MQVSIGGSRSNNSAVAKEFCENFCKVIGEHEYSEEQMYNCDKTALYYRMLPNKSVDFNKLANKYGKKMSKERVASRKKIHMKLPLIFMIDYR
jgi:uncharacterized protein YajQ (UPF0234 family)